MRTPRVCMTQAFRGCGYSVFLSASGTPPPSLIGWYCGAGIPYRKEVMRDGCDAPVRQDRVADREE
jgi:hypothetical protein